jgi:hypothetical protein
MPSCSRPNGTPATPALSMPRPKTPPPGRPFTETTSASCTPADALISHVPSATSAPRFHGIIIDRVSGYEIMTHWLPTSWNGRPAHHPDSRNELPAIKFPIDSAGPTGGHPFHVCPSASFAFSQCSRWSGFAVSGFGKGKSLGGETWREFPRSEIKRRSLSRPTSGRLRKYAGLS